MKYDVEVYLLVFNDEQVGRDGEGLVLFFLLLGNFNIWVGLFDNNRYLLYDFLLLLNNLVENVGYFILFWYIVLY